MGCEEVIPKLRDYQNIALTTAARGMDPRNKIFMNFIFKSPPGQSISHYWYINLNYEGMGKTMTARKIGQVFYYDMGFLAVPEV